MFTKEFIDSISEESILKKVIDDLRNYRKNNNGNFAKEVHFNTEGFEELEKTNFFNANFYNADKLHREGYFEILGVKCFIKTYNMEKYEIIKNPKDEYKESVLNKRP